MTAQIDTLISDLDAFEVVRRKVAAILVEELAEQQLLATAAAEDPELYRAEVYEERTNPWAVWLDPATADFAPIINVSIQDVSFKGRFQSQVKTEATIAIDCFGGAISEETEEGHDPADYLAANRAQRAAKLARQILCSDYYQYLGLRSLVGSSVPISLEALQVDTGSAGLAAMAVRYTHRVSFLSAAPEVTPGVLETLAATFTDPVTGAVRLQVELDLTE